MPDRSKRTEFIFSILYGGFAACLLIGNMLFLCLFTGNFFESFERGKKHAC